MDGTVFDAYRPAVWQALCAEYPIRLDPKSLKGEQLLDIENPITYVQRQQKRWKQEIEGNPEGDPLMATLFRNAVIDAMPQAVKQSLQMHTRFLYPYLMSILNNPGRWDVKDNLDREEEASLILVLQECAEDVNNTDIQN